MDSSVDGSRSALRKTEDGGRRTEVRNPSSVFRLPSSALFLLPTAFLILFYFYPLASIFQESFARSKAGLLAPFVFAFTSPSVIKVISFTFYQAALSTIATLALGLPGAYLLARYRFPGQSLLRA